MLARRSIAAGLVACAVVSRSASAPAQTSPTGLRVARSPSAGDCPSDATLAAAVERLLKRPVFGEGGRDEVRVDVEFDRSPTGVHALLRLDGVKRGERRLDDAGPDCGALADAVEITLALLLDANADLAGREAPRSDTSRPAVAAPRRAPTRFGVEAEGGAAFGLVGGPTGWVGGAFVIDPVGPFDFAIGGRWYARRETVIGAGSVDTGLAAAFVRVCAAAWRPEALSLAACVEPRLGALHGRGEGFESSRSASFVWTAFGAGVELRRRVVGPLEASLRAEAVVPTRHQSFSIDPLGAGFRSSAVGSEIGAGVGVSF